MPETDTTTLEETTDTEQVEAGNPETTDQTETPPPGEELGDGGKKAIEAEREARKQAERQLRQAKAALKEYEEQAAQIAQLREQAEIAEKRAIEAEQERLRQKVASDKGVPVSRLTGVTEEELSAAADELIAWRDQSKPPAPPAPAKRPDHESLRSGASGVENTASDPKVVAAESLRQLRRHG